MIGDPNGCHEIVAGEVAHVLFGCRGVVHGGAEVFVEGGAKVHAYHGAKIHLLATDSYMCYDGQVDCDGIGRVLKHRPGLVCV